MMAKFGTNLKQGASRAGFTFVEIVISFIIIGILTLVMIPTLARRADEAKIAAAQKDLETLADAFERVAIDTGALVRMYILNDVKGGDGLANYFVDDVVNGLNDSLFSNTIYLQSQRMFISPATQDFYSDPQQVILFNKLATEETNYNTQVRWLGPYVNWQRDVNRNDWPDDPWGNDYLFFSKNGILYPPQPENPDPNLQIDGSYQFLIVGPDYGFGTLPDAEQFDRFTVLSLGPNGLPGDGSNIDPGGKFGRGDDIVRSFGGS